MTKHTRNDVVYSIAKLNSLVIVPMSLLPWQEESSEALHPFDTARARQLYHAVSCYMEVSENESTRYPQIIQNWL